MSPSEATGTVSTANSAGAPGMGSLLKRYGLGLLAAVLIAGKLLAGFFGNHGTPPVPADVLARIQAEAEHGRNGGSTRPAATPAGTAMYHYQVQGSHRQANGDERNFSRFYWVWQEAGGTWRFLKNTGMASDREQ